ncbi:MAG: PQQ-like beta-propeller repeat protein [Firmicutes bacterium]|nr:PQQ-like beta-propeller repeat protein [Bacillota bacterium]
MKKRKFIISLIAVLLILFVPIPIGQYKDGGTKDYLSFTYRIVAWNRLLEDGSIFQKTSVYWFPENYKDIGSLWESEKPDMEGSYILNSSHEVDGRQGIAWEAGLYYVSGSTTLSVYDADWQLIKSQDDPFAAFTAEVNHIGDIDVYEGEIYAGVELFLDGEASNIQAAVYDAQTLELKRTYMFDKRSGQTEVSGIAVDPDHGCIWMCSWAEDDSGSFLYRYDLEDGDYLGKVRMENAPKLIQGIAYLDGYIYITSDDGDAGEDAPDHVYKCQVDTGLEVYEVVLERTVYDVIRQGEIEGISFDKDKNQMLISYNRGAIIVKGMPKGFYIGYDSEIHEVFVYDIIIGSNDRITKVRGSLPRTLFFENVILLPYRPFIRTARASNTAPAKTNQNAYPASTATTPSLATRPRTMRISAI